jgi:hypothetical protein
MDPLKITIVFLRINGWLMLFYAIHGATYPLQRVAGLLQRGDTEFVPWTGFFAPDVIRFALYESSSQGHAFWGHKIARGHPRPPGLAPTWGRIQWISAQLRNPSQISKKRWDWEINSGGGRSRPFECRDQNPLTCRVESRTGAVSR